MMPWRQLPLTSSVIEVFNGLHGEARKKAIATGNYNELVKQRPEREAGEDSQEVVA